MSTSAVVKRKRRAGRVPGVPVPSTERAAAASRVNGWKHGKYARVVTPMEAERARLSRIHKDLPELVDSYAAQVTRDDPSGTDAILVGAMAETEFIRRDTGRAIRERGVLIEEAMVNSEGKPIGSRTKVNPALEPYRWLAEHVGATADQMQLSRKSRGEGARDEAIAAALRRDLLLRGSDKSAMPPPADYVDTTTVEEEP